ncbi:MAG: VCBS repeat-containing protein [Planctomycetes bacterium]|nr:VCBS repeat-containing protein [Planctomycetota bacterium]
MRRIARPIRGWVALCLRSLAVFALTGGSAFGGGWVDFVNESDSRLVAPDELGLGDTEEKDYAWGDVDNDGDIDLIVVRKQPFTTTGKRVNVLFMNEGGVLVDRTTEFATDSNVIGDEGFHTPTNDRDVVLADVNGDGWLDVVTAVTLTDNQAKHLSHPRVYINKGEVDGAWQGFRFENERIPEMHPDAGPRFCAVSAGDVTGDGAPDLYFSDYDSPADQIFDFNDRLLVNDGNGFFSDETTLRLTDEMYTADFGISNNIADMNGDGVNDIVRLTSLSVPYHIGISYNDPSAEGFFSAYDQVYVQAPYHSEVGDLNADGRLDIVALDDGVDRYLLNQGNNAEGTAVFLQFTFPSQTNVVNAGNVVIDDFDKDGWNDVIIADVDVTLEGCDHRTFIFHNQVNPPNVTFVEEGEVIPDEMLTGVYDVAAFDINGDGWLDLVLGRCTGTDVWMAVPPVNVEFLYPEGLPQLVSPTDGTTFTVSLDVIGGALVADSPMIHVAENGGDFVAAPLELLDGGIYSAWLPSGDCLDELSFFITADIDGAGTFTDPPNGAYTAFRAAGQVPVLEDDIEGDVSAWTVWSDESLIAGEWEQADPNGTVFNGIPIAPDDDATPGDGVMAFVTENGPVGGDALATDVDGGPTRLVSPAVDLAGTDGRVEFAYWLVSQLETDDTLSVELSNDGGLSWTLAETIAPTVGVWSALDLRVGAFVQPTADVRVRFSVADVPNNSITEAAIDDFAVIQFECGSDVPVSIVSSDPPDGARDARQPFDPDGENPTGWNSLQITFSGEATGVTVSDFTVTHTAEGPAPVVTAVTVDGSIVGLELSESIAPLSWTTITHAASDTSTRLGYLPADVNEDGISTAGDVLALIDALNGVTDLPEYKTDTDRSGASNAADILRVIDLLNGAGAYDPYLNAALRE